MPKGNLAVLKYLRIALDIRDVPSFAPLGLALVF
jgi:hypothetical protein